MRLRELTTNIRQPINEIDIIGGLKWLGRAALSGPATAAQIALTPSSTSAWDTTDAPAMLYNKLRADGRDDATANAAALELRDRIRRGDHTAIQTYRDATGDTGQLPWDLQDLQTSIDQRIASGGGRGNGAAELAQRRADAANGVPGAGPAPTDSPNAQTKAPEQPTSPGKLDDPSTKIPQTPNPVTKIEPKPAPKAPTPPQADAVPASVSNLPNVVKDAGAAQALAQSNPQTASQWADGISKATGGTLGASTVQSLSQGAMKYGLPAAAIVALLYGGKKLLDYVGSKKKKESIGEEATAGVTSAGNNASLANPKHATGQVGRDKNGLPKKKSRKQPGTNLVANALDNDDSFFGSKTIKR